MQEDTQQENMEEEAAETGIKENADAIIKKHVYVAMGISIIPVPFLDFAGVAGTQLNMLRRLAEIYEVPFSKDMVKNLIGALLGSAFPASLGAQLGGSLAKAIPVIGFPAGAASMAAVGGASTYAVGKIFNRHFAEGGTFLSFDAEEAKAFYQEMFKEGEKVVADMKSKKK